MKNEAIGNTIHVNQTDWNTIKAMSDTDIVHDTDSPATTEEDWAQAFISHSASELHAQTQRRKQASQERVAIHVDAEVLAYFRATGKDWQNRLNEALKEWLKEHAC